MGGLGLLGLAGLGISLVFGLGGLVLGIGGLVLGLSLSLVGLGGLWLGLALGLSGLDPEHLGGLVLRLVLCVGLVLVLVGLGGLGLGLVLGNGGLVPKNLSSLVSKHLWQPVVLLGEDLVELVFLRGKNHVLLIVLLGEDLPYTACRSSWRGPSTAFCFSLFSARTLYSFITF